MREGFAPCGGVDAMMWEAARAYRLLRSTSAFLQTRLEYRRPTPLILVRAYMTFCLPSTLVLRSRRMNWKFDFSPETRANYCAFHPSALCSPQIASILERFLHMMGELLRRLLVVEMLDFVRPFRRAIRLARWDC